MQLPGLKYDALGYYSLLPIRGLLFLPSLPPHHRKKKECSMSPSQTLPNILFKTQKHSLIANRPTCKWVGKLKNVDVRSLFFFFRLSLRRTLFGWVCERWLSFFEGCERCLRVAGESGILLGATHTNMYAVLLIFLSLPLSPLSLISLPHLSLSLSLSLSLGVCVCVCEGVALIMSPPKQNAGPFEWV